MEPEGGNEPRARSQHTLATGAAETAVQVYTRFRPLNKRELAAPDAVFLDDTDDELAGLGDHVFARDAEQSTVYDAVVRATVGDVLAGFNGTIFACNYTSHLPVACCALAEPSLVAVVAAMLW